MPELPEVETIRQDLRAVLRKKKITAVTVRKPRMVVGSPRKLVVTLRGNTITEIDRRAKLLIFHLQRGDHFLLLHLKMTGQLIYRSPRTTIAGGHGWPPVGPDLPNKYSHLIITFADRGQLFFNDLRQFGYVELVTREHKEMITKTYGIEPLTPEFTWPAFREAVRPRTAPLKQVLLNQAVIAGLGNIYVDEVCFYAKVRPQRRAHRLTHAELKQLYRGCNHIIQQAIKHRGTTFSDYRDTQGRRGNYWRRLKVYGRAGKPCRRCATALQKTMVAGRGTTYCPQCQP
ncbi:MAG: bifunctional DNA-formamidopyrimidine glycosylase/DNA-(apurinic or apyrimidinic site) lyase [Candidatus Andersenbacteria bacterium]